MANRFPGVDPFIEDQHLWPDFHSTIIQTWREAVRRALPPNYVARIDERVSVIDYVEAEGLRFGPDVSVEKLDAPAVPQKSPKSASAVLEPVVIPMLIEEETREAYVKILHHPDNTLVTVLEVLSPTNKCEPGRSAFRTKHNELLKQSVHLVNLDLLVGGKRLPLKKPYPPGDFFALVARADLVPDCLVYPWSLRDPLPVISIPLLPEDGDIEIDLAPVYATALERGDYESSIDYARPLSIRIGKPDADWVKERTAIK